MYRTFSTHSSHFSVTRAQDVRDRLAFLRRRHTDTSLDGSSSDSKGSGRPTPADIVAWSKKFDNLLSDPCKFT